MEQISQIYLNLYYTIVFLYGKEIKFISLFSRLIIIIWWGGRAAMRSPAE